MSKTIVILKQVKDNGSKRVSMTPEILCEHTFFEYLMNCNQKATADQNESVREKLCPILADIFLAETEDFTELILANFEFSLDNTERDHLCQLQNNKQKLSFMFNHSIIKFQKDMKDLGFTKALTQNEEFYIMTNLHYKKISPTKALEVLDLCQGSL